MEMTAVGSGEVLYAVYTVKEVFTMIKEYLKNELVFFNQTHTLIIEHLEKNISEKLGRSVRIGRHTKVRLFCSFHKMHSVWQNVNMKEELFFKNYGERELNAPVHFPVYTTSQKTKGGPSTEFTFSGEQPKRRKTEELACATQMSLRPAGLDASKVVEEASPTRPVTTPQKAFYLPTENILSEDAALSVLVEYKFSKHQYLGLRSVSKENHCKLYPSYKKVMQAKNRCYPPRAAVTVTERSAEVRLQALLDHTVERILFLQRDVVRSLTQKGVSSMNFTYKWACDESSRQSERTFIDDSESDANMFLTSVVPLQLTSVDHESRTQIVVWKNPRPSSSRFCRPLRLQFPHKESTVEAQHIEKQIKSLAPFETVINGKEISIMYNLTVTTIDGKVCNAFTKRCYLCGATSKDFNKIDAILQKETDETNIKFGLSILHAWIRFFECCLHLSYKLDIKKWQSRSAKEKQMMEDRKRKIQKGFRLQLGLIVDRPNSGHGSTNDESTARRFFENSALSASITGLDVNLIERFHVILQAISSGHEINCDKFQRYAVETAKNFVELYPWYYMPTSVHMILMHSPQVIAHALLPSGQLSEDAQEARNKSIERYREDFSQKCSRAEIMKDIFNWLMVTSDPYISSIRKLPQKKPKSLSQEAVELLLFPTVTVATGTESDCTSSEVDTASDVDSNSA